MKKIFFLPLCLLFHSYAQGQDNPNNSFFVTVNDGLRVLSTYKSQLAGKSYGVDIGYQVNMSNSSAEWVGSLNVSGISFVGSYFNMQNISLSGMPGSKGSIGSGYGISSGLDLSLFKIGAATFSFSPGIGIVYLTQTFYNNNYNFIVGSNVNIMLRAGLKLQIPTGPSTGIQLGTSVIHCSNGCFQKPDDGLNIVNVSLGIIKYIDYGGPAKPNSFADGGDDSFESNSFEFALTAGRQGDANLGLFKNPKTGQNMWLPDSVAKKNKAGVYQAHFYAGYNYQITAPLSLRVGVDGVYYQKTFSYQNFFQTYQGMFTSYKHISLGISAGGRLWLGRIAFDVNFGYYVYYAALYPDQHFYIIPGAECYLNSRIAVTVKTFMAQSLAPQDLSLGLVLNVK